MTDPIADRAFDLLRAHSPLTEDEWCEILVAHGVGNAREMRELIQSFDVPWLGFLPDGRYMALDVLYRDRILTHRLTAVEIDAGLIAADPDLSPMLTGPDSADIEGFGGARTAYDKLDADILDGRELPGYTHRILVFAPSALAELTPGTLIGLQIVDGRARLRVVSEPIAPPSVTVAAIECRVAEDGVTEIDDVCWEAMQADPRLFTRPTLPLSELVTAAGLVRKGNLIAQPGFDFDNMPGIDPAEILQVIDKLTEEQARAVVAFTELTDAVAAAPAEEQAAILAAASLDEFVPMGAERPARSALEELTVRSECDPNALVTVAEHVARHGPRKLVAAAHWLAARAVEVLDRLDEAQHHLDAAVGADPFWVLALADRARYAIDRGEFTQALGLFDRIDGGQRFPIYWLLEEIVTAGPELGRNDRCWCGSGRKYKVCHLGRGEPTLAQRARLLYQRACVHCDQPEWRRVRTKLGMVRSRHWDTGSLHALDDPLVVDITMFEAGGYADYLARRGHLLTADDRLITEQWQTVRRSIYKTERVHPGRGITLRDLRTDEHHIIASPFASHHLHQGQLYCCRLVPAGEEMIAGGSFEPVTDEQCEGLFALLDDETTEPDQLIEFLSTRFEECPEDQ
ncbi:YecA family protein [Nocardia terpenica]|uniref:SEC-C domain-containing protein n=1 Tax=Nocardia terpenica TaxID=455432 RepID=A0A164PE92_9NOCA|nr:SEC-C metal-binding domain-containing protein [Nocardia terpenica]KZM75453.1 hypothetical protein AWN90_18915 [Nocardia terpenica]NQE85919.1 SEC-C domain-containing protein [Nocardia terpenica]BBE00941.1 hypothetical protein [Nocardia terpenica]